MRTNFTEMTDVRQHMRLHMPKNSDATSYCLSDSSGSNG